MDGIPSALSTEQIESVLSALERVFSGESEFEDAFETLNMHTARVRRTFPHVYQVLRSPPGLANSVQAALDDGSLHDLETLTARVLDSKLGALVPLIVTSVVAAMPKQVAYVPTNGNGQPQYQVPAQVAVPVDDGFGGKTMEEPIVKGSFEPSAALPPGMQIYDYQPWAQQLAPTSQVKQKWAIRWDNPAPMKSVGETITVRGPDARYRFAVREQIDASVQLWEFIKLLPYQRE